MTIREESVTLSCYLTRNVTNIGTHSVRSLQPFSQVDDTENRMTNKDDCISVYLYTWLWHCIETIIDTAGDIDTAQK